MRAGVCAFVPVSLSIIREGISDTDLQTGIYKYGLIQTVTEIKVSKLKSKTSRIHMFPHIREFHRVSDVGLSRIGRHVAISHNIRTAVVASTRFCRQISLSKCLRSRVGRSAVTYRSD